MGLDDQYTAYCFDEACFLWGNYVSNEVQDAGEKAKTDKSRENARKSKLHQLLNGPEPDVELDPYRLTTKKAKEEDTEEDPLVKEARELGISEATLRATKRFDKRQFKDPAPLFQGGGKKVTG